MRFQLSSLTLLTTFCLTGCVGHLVDRTATTVPTGLAADTTEKDIAVADLDRDGDLDVVVARKQYLSQLDGLTIPDNNLNPAVARTPILLLNDGSGRLVDRTPSSWTATPQASRDVVIADLNGDGAPDVLFVNTASMQPTLYLGRGSGSAWSLEAASDLLPTLVPTVGTEQTPVLFCAADVGDVDGDGDLDVYFSNYIPGGRTADVLLINRLDEAPARFEDESIARLSDLRYSAFGTSVLLRDMNDDGFTDIVKTSTLNAVPPWNRQGAFILYNRDDDADGRADGRFFSGTVDSADFTPLAAPASYMLEVADFNDDGAQDVYEVDDRTDYITFGRRVGSRVVHERDRAVLLDRSDIQNLTGGVGGNVHAGDFDGDGTVDFLGVAPLDVQFSVTTCGPAASDLALFRNVAADPDLADLEGLEGQDLLPAANPPSTGQPWKEAAHDFAFGDFDGNGETDMFLALCSGYKMLLNIRR